MSNSRYQQRLKKEPASKSYKMKDNKVQAKRQDKYTLQLAKESVATNKKWVPNKYTLQVANDIEDLNVPYASAQRLNFSTPTHQFVGLVLFFGILSSHRVYAQPFLPTCPNHKDGDIKGLFAKTFPSNSLVHVDPCAGKLNIAGNEVLLSCTNSASKFVNNNPIAYQNAFHSIQGAINNLEKTQTINCRFAYLFSSESNCKIQLTTNEELFNAYGTSSGVYVLEPHIIYMGMEQEFLKRKTVLLHETVHALDMDGNKLEKIKYKEKPYSNEIEKEKFDSIIKNGIKNLNHFYKLLNTQVRMLSESEKALLEELNRLSAEYTPQIIFEKMKSISPMQMNTVEIKTEQGIMDFPLRRLASQTASDGEIEVAHIPHGQTPLHSALLDGFVYAHLTSLYPQSRYEAEINAYMHQTYETYPELFQKIFPGLTEYLTSRGSQSYQSCMNQQHSQFGGTSTLFSAKQSGKPEQKVTQDNIKGVKCH